LPLEQGLDDTLLKMTPGQLSLHFSPTKQYPEIFSAA